MLWQAAFPTFVDLLAMTAAASPHALPCADIEYPKTLAPAPWTLTGQGYLIALKMPDEMLDNCPFTPTALRRSRRSNLSFAMLVNYDNSPAGSYQELLFIPGSFQFSDARRASISRIYVSSLASVVNGRRNWGIPKDRCNFALDFNDHGIDSARLTADNGDMIAELLLSHSGPKLPLPTTLLPKAMRTLSQIWEGREYTLTPSTTGHGKWAKVIDWTFNADYFPDLAQGRCVGAMKITDFTMVFPEPRVRSWHG
ncbi:MAG: hypothetical protein ABIR53_06530 [Paraperlucidibaca sp.]